MPKSVTQTPPASAFVTVSETKPDSSRLWPLFRTLVPGRPLLILALTLGLYLALLVPRLIWLNENEGLVAGHLHLWGDWPFHIAMIQRFAACPPTQWLAEHPMIGGEPLRYPFATSLISGMLMRLGFSLPSAIILPTLFCFALLLPGMYVLFRLLIGGTYRPLLAIYLFFCAAGPGFLTWVGEWLHKPSLSLLLFPPKEYSAAPKYEWYSSNFLSAMLLPQRAFLLGLTTAVWVLVLLLLTLTYWDRLRRDKREWLLGICALMGGLMPVIHMHSLLALSLICLGVLVPFAGRSRHRWRSLLVYFVLPGLLLAGGMYRTFIAPVRPYPDFVAWMPGLNAKAGLLDWLAMWWQFWGIALPLSLISFVLIVRQEKRDRWRPGFFAGTAALFVVANLVRFQPIPWDNSKLFLWVYLALSGLLANLMAQIWNRRTVLARSGAVVLAACLMMTGALELISLQRIDRNQQQLLNTTDLRLGESIRDLTSPDSVFLTGTDIGHWVMVWGGRPIYLGFTGWMPNFGFVHNQREQDIKTIYAGGPEAGKSLGANPIDYVVIGPSETRAFHPNEAWFRQMYPVLLQRGDTTLYAVSERARRQLAVSGTAF